MAMAAVVGALLALPRSCAVVGALLALPRSCAPDAPGTAPVASGSIARARGPRVQTQHAGPGHLAMKTGGSRRQTRG